MRNQEWDSALAQLYPLNFRQLVFCFFSCDAVDGKTALGIVDKAEILASLLDGDHVHEAGRVGGVGPYFAVDFDEALHDNSFGFAGVEGILQTGERERAFVSQNSRAGLPGKWRYSPITNEDDKGHAVPQSMWTWRWTRGIGTGQFVQEPVRWRTETLLVLLPVWRYRYQRCFVEHKLQLNSPRSYTYGPRPIAAVLLNQLLLKFFSDRRDLDHIKGSVERQLVSEALSWRQVLLSSISPPLFPCSKARRPPSFLQTLIFASIAAILGPHYSPNPFLKFDPPAEISFLKYICIDCI